MKNSLNINSQSHQLGKEFWENKYQNDDTGWDIGGPSPALVEYMKQIPNKDAEILIPGAGNAYEIESLLQDDFKNITIVDIADSPTQKLISKYQNDERVQIIQDDFFNLKDKYDIILEQTFFCALDPDFRNKYIEKMYELLEDNGTLAGVLFNREFEKAGPPFGGTKEEYQRLFSKLFEVKTIETCYNSIEPRKGNELFIIMNKNNRSIRKNY